jgi:hypothetical protein
MSKIEIKSRMEEIRRNLDVMECDKKFSGIITKKHLYDQLKEEYEKLEKNLNNEKKDGKESELIHSSSQ